MEHADGLNKMESKHRLSNLRGDPRQPIHIKISCLPFQMLQLWKGNQTGIASHGLPINALQTKL